MLRASPGSLAFLLVCLLFAGCATRPASPHLQRFAFESAQMGTLFTITLYATNEPAASAAADAAFRRIAALEEIMSDYQADSELMLLCDKPAGAPVHVSAELFDVLQKAQRLSSLSGGAFDVTMGPYVRLWRFSRKRKTLPTAEALAEAGKAVGFEKLRLDPRARTVTLLAPNIRLDLGGIAKGYAADEGLRVLKEAGIRSALVAASGDIAIGDPPPGQKAWKVAISGLDAGTNTPTRRLLLRNAGISTSGDTEQSIEINGIRFSHILSPKTGLGLTNRIQATVVAGNATTTDALATTVCVLGPKQGLKLVDSLPGVAALVLTKEEGETWQFVSRRFAKLRKE